MKKYLALSFFSFIAAIAINFTSSQIYPAVLREDVKFVPPKEISDFLSLDHRGFLTDLYFIQVNLHSGSLMWKPTQFGFDSEWSYKMMDLITDLDPKYYTAYLFSGMGLIHDFDDVKRARPILEKGMKNFPESWEIPFWIGYDYHVYLEDFETAAEYLWQASQKPDAPKHFLALTLSSLRKGGSYERGSKILQIMIENTNNEQLKIVYEKKRQVLETLAFLQKSALDFQKSKGHFPKELKDLLRAKILKHIPENSEGIEYYWDTEKNRVVLKKN